MDDAAPIIAIIEDDEAVRRALVRLILSLDYETCEFSSGEDYIAGLHSRKTSCVLTDYHMNGMSGLDVLLEIRLLKRSPPVIIMTGYDEPGKRETCLNAGAAAYLVKPFERDLLASTVRHVLNR